MRRDAELHIVWFKRDLRSEDHAALAAAAASGPVLPLYIAEPDLWAEPDSSGRQWAFVAESLHELRADLAARGQALVVRVGDAVEILEGLRRDLGIAALWSHQETGNGWTYARDLRVGAWAREAGIPWHEPVQGGVQRRLRTRDGWARHWDATMALPLVSAPPLPPVPGIDLGEIPDAHALGLATDPCPDRQPGGRRGGRALLESFLATRGEPYRRAMSSPLAGAEACSRLSPHLAWGTLSMRETAQATWTRQRDLKAAAKEGAKVGRWRGSMVSFQGRLHWRDHFMQKLEDEPRLEFENLHRGYNGLRPDDPDPARLRAWSAGETGLPFVDACMRYLRAGGWLNFRMRAMVTAVASYHLWLPWRASGLVLARRFTDYEPGIHWPQCQMQSGTTGINTVRIYNPVKQGHDQDPDGVFTRHWVPELRDVPDAFLQTPWAWDGAAKILGKTYPEPIVDPVAAARAARQKVYAVRKGPAFRSEASAIQAKHGSRKSGMRMTGRKRRTRATDASVDQLGLPLGGGQVK